MATQIVYTTRTKQDTPQGLFLYPREEGVLVSFDSNSSGDILDYPLTEISGVNTINMSRYGRPQTIRR